MQSVYALYVNNGATMTQTSGSLTTVGPDWSGGFQLGDTDGRTGNYSISGGSLATTAWQAPVIFNGTFNQSGGTVTVPGYFAVGAQRPPKRHRRVRDHGWDAQRGRDRADITLCDWGGSNGVFTISGSGVVNTPDIRVSNGTGVGTLNLNGGLFVTGSVQGGSGATVCFNGGTLRASGGNDSFMTGLGHACVGTGGAVIDSQDFAITIARIWSTMRPTLAPPPTAA